MLNAGLLGAIAAGAEASSSPPDLPFFGQYYGSVFRGNVGDTHLDQGSYPGTFCVFRAERTGIVTQIDWYYRFDYDAASYSRGTGGAYTIEIWPASEATRLPDTTGSPICRVNNWAPAFASGAGQHFVPGLNFHTTGQLIAKQLYALVVINTHASPGSNFVSQNTPVAYAFDDDTDPANYAEPGDGIGGAIFPQNVGSSIAPIRGWHPAVIDGSLNMYPTPAIYRNNFRYRRLGVAGMLMALIYSDGQRATYTCWGGENSYNLTINSTSHVRERFKVTRATRTVSGVFIRVSRRNNSAGNCVVTLESGPASTGSGNGSTIESVNVPASNFLNCSGFNQENWVEGLGSPPFEKVHWVWVPFSTNRTLTLGNIYSIRLSASGGFDGRMWMQNRWEAPGGSPDSHGNDFDTYIAQRTVGMNAWEDSMGVQTSTNGGSSWAFFSRRMAPILFKCV